jgi:hypothetical protein
MNSEDINKMWMQSQDDAEGMRLGFTTQQHYFAAMVAAAERNKLAAWMIRFGLSTGHGDTMEQLCDALGTEIADSIDFAVDVEREQCARLAEEVVDGKRWFNDLPSAIRARSNA